MPEILTMIQIQRLTPTPAVLIMALLSMVYLTVSDIFALINYVGFATWVRKRIIIGVVATELQRPHAGKNISFNFFSG